MLCDACKVRPDWKGEHRCHAPAGDVPRPMTVNGKNVVGNCECAQCRVPTKEEIKAILEKAT